MAEKMQLDDGTSSISISPLVGTHNQPDARGRGYCQYDGGPRQYYDIGAAERVEIQVNDISQTHAELLNTWWRSLTILTVTPDTDVPAITYYARVSPGGQRPLQMWFDTGYQNRYAGTITLHEVSSSPS